MSTFEVFRKNHVNIRQRHQSKGVITSPVAPVSCDLIKKLQNWQNVTVSRSLMTRPAASRTCKPWSKCRASWPLRASTQTRRTKPQRSQKQSGKQFSPSRLCSSSRTTNNLKLHPGKKRVDVLWPVFQLVATSWSASSFHSCSDGQLVGAKKSRAAEVGFLCLPSLFYTF